MLNTRMDFKMWLERKFLEPSSEVDASIEKFITKLPALIAYLKGEDLTQEKYPNQNLGILFYIC